MKANNKLIIWANNIHQGGGRSLLLTFLSALRPGERTIVAVDSRLKIEKILPKDVEIKKINPTILARLRSEWWLYKNLRQSGTVLCFGNLPPLFQSRGNVFVYVQNRHLIDNTDLSGFSFKDKIRITLEKKWLYYFAKNAHGFIVQTPTMKNLLQSYLGSTTEIMILPFVNSTNGYTLKVNEEQGTLAEKKYDFIYVASGESHKNHFQLIKAWELLAQENIYPSLCLTIDQDKFKILFKFINERVAASGIKIINQGEVTQDQVACLYATSKALIYPSLLESFGMPLVEARQASLPIIASELDYVRDLITPEETFDPQSPTSIARAIKRFLKIDENPLKLLDAEKFMSKLLSLAEKNE